jgi:hypothetical protein
MGLSIYYLKKYNNKPLETRMDKGFALKRLVMPSSSPFLGNSG